MTMRFTLDDDRSIAERKARYIAYAGGAVALGQANAYYPAIGRAVGSATAAVFLSQLLYWTGRGKLADGWIYKTQADWEDETALTRREQETARRILRERGLIEETLRGVPATVHYRLDMEVLGALLAGDAPNQFGGFVQTRKAESAKLERRNQPNQIGGNRQTINSTETTAEITPEITAGPPAAPRRTHKGYLADPLCILWDQQFGKRPTLGQLTRIHELADIAAGKGLFDLVPNAIRATALDGKGFRWFESKAEAWITNGGPDARPRAPRTRALNTGTGGGTSTGTPAPMTDEQTREWQERYARQNGYADQQAAG